MARSRKKTGEGTPRSSPLEKSCTLSTIDPNKKRPGRKNILKFPAHNGNGNGNYIPYCHNPVHPGFIKNDRTCIERDCTHYKKIYLKDL